MATHGTSGNGDSRRGSAGRTESYLTLGSGAAIPHIASDAVLRQLRDQGINMSDLSKLDLSDFEKVLSDLDDTTIDVDSGRAQIRFSSE